VRADREAELRRHNFDRRHGVDSDWIDARDGRDADEYKEEGGLTYLRDKRTQLP
jgi:hypothetical protein